MIKPHLPIFLFAATDSCVAQESIPNAAEVRSFYETGLRKNGIVGSSLVLVRQGHVVLQDQYGLQNLSPKPPVDENTTYHWASITKTFTGIAIMQLRDRGLLSLDDSLIKYIPELAAVHDPYGTVSQITIRHAMSHSGGFRDPTWPWRDQDWQPFEPTQWSQLVAMMPIPMWPSLRARGLAIPTSEWCFWAGSPATGSRNRYPCFETVRIAP